MPFTKDASNQGLASCDISGSYTPVVSGKIGNAHNSQYPIQITSDTLRNKSNFTVSFWIYNSSNYTNKLDWVKAVIINTKNDKLNTSGAIMFECCYDTNPRAVSVHNNSACDYFTSSITIVYEKDEWHHVAFVADGSYCKAYCDGELIGSMQEQSGTPALTGTITIGSSNYVGAINDFRIYDTPLSQKEIKYLSQGLICHLPLSSASETGSKNKYDGTIAEGLLTGSMTKTPLVGERGYNYKLSFTGTGDNTWFSIYASNFPFTAGRNYVYSCKVRCHSNNGVNLSFRAARSNNDWVTKMDQVTNADGKWHEYSIVQTINETYDRSGTTVTCNPRVEFYTNNLNSEGVKYSLDLDIKDIQVVEADHYIPYIDNDFSSHIVSDVSGFVNHGTISDGTAPSWGDNSPRYSGCYEFNGSNTIQIENSFFHDDVNQCHTICAWVNLSTYGEGSKRQSLINLNQGYYIVYGSTNKTLMYLNGGANDSYVYGEALPLNQWTHLTWVLDTATQKCEVYYNGKLKAKSTNYTSSDLPSGVNKNLIIGQNFIGKLSDLRIYATALSAASIESIYKSAASITNTGSLLLSGEVIER